MKGIIRQGDILLVPVESAPPANAKHQRQVILAEGETTGHAHRLSAADILEWSVGEQRHVRIVGTELGTLQHEDHDPIPAAVVEPEQTYRVVRQQTWDLSEQWQKVQD